jgi:hypothetical protein
MRVHSRTVQKAGRCALVWFPALRRARSGRRSVGWAGGGGLPFRPTATVPPRIARRHGHTATYGASVRAVVRVRQVVVPPCARVYDRLAARCSWLAMEPSEWTSQRQQRGRDPGRLDSASAAICIFFSLKMMMGEKGSDRRSIPALTVFVS